MRFTSYLRPCIIKNPSGVADTDSRLAMTPAMMMSLTNQGRSVSLASLADYSYFTNEPHVEDMPLENTRGVDMNILWSHAKDATNKLKKFSKHLYNQDKAVQYADTSSK